MLKGNCNNSFAKTCKFVIPVFVVLWPLCREAKKRICFSWHMSSFTTAWEVQVCMSSPCFVLAWFMSAYVCVVALPCGGGTWERRRGVAQEHQASFCPWDEGQQSPEERTLGCEWQACRAARVGAGLVHTSADVKECTSGNSMPHQPRSPYLKTVSQFLLQSFIEGL